MLFAARPHVFCFHSARDLPIDENAKKFPTHCEMISPPLLLLVACSGGGVKKKKKKKVRREFDFSVSKITRFFL
jgi:hypothetical protein